MATIKMVTEEEAKGKVKEVYEDIMAQIGIDFVPNDVENQLIVEDKNIIQSPASASGASISCRNTL